MKPTSKWAIFCALSLFGPYKQRGNSNKYKTLEDEDSFEN
jgi:hypothetical protein